MDDMTYNAKAQQAVEESSDLPSALMLIALWEHDRVSRSGKETYFRRCFIRVLKEWEKKQAAELERQED